jgi:hypothetical protein
VKESCGALAWGSTPVFVWKDWRKPQNTWGQSGSGRDLKQVRPDCKSEASLLEPTYYVNEKGTLNCVESLRLLKYVENITAQGQRMSQSGGGTQHGIRTIRAKSRYVEIQGDVRGTVYRVCHLNRSTNYKLYMQPYKCLRNFLVGVRIVKCFTNSCKRFRCEVMFENENTLRLWIHKE